MEEKGRLGIERHVGLAQRFVVAERLIHAAQHHVEFGVLGIPGPISLSAPTT